MKALKTVYNRVSPDKGPATQHPTRQRAAVDKKYTSKAETVQYVLDTLTQIDGVELLDPKYLAVGGFGIVFRAVLGATPVAVKVMSQPYKNGRGQIVVSPMMLDFFLMEMSLIAQMDHPCAPLPQCLVIPVPDIRHWESSMY